MPAGDENVLQSAHDGDGSDVRSGSIADILTASADVCFESGHENEGF
jgi:hypothetical protein